MKIKYITFLFLIFILSIKIPTVSAEMEQFTDENGVIHLYNDPNYIPKKTESVVGLQQTAYEMEEELSSTTFEESFYTECKVKKSKPHPHISCVMYFPYSFNNMKYIHKIKVLTLQKTLSFAIRDSIESFKIYAVLKGGGDKEAARMVKESKVKGDFIPVAAYSYWKESDSIYSIWPSY